LNVFGPGLCVEHYGSIVVNENAGIGANCRIHEGTTIGVNGLNIYEVPQIGDNVYIASGAKIIGSIKITNGIAIGANAVVTKDFLEENITIAGVPAKKINNNDSSFHLIKATEIYNSL
jgi:serine O-acetyltransferase